MNKKDKILFLPSVLKGNGTGHLKRCVNWSLNLPVQNFYVPRGEESFSDQEIDRITGSCCNPRIYRDDPGSEWDLLILDNRDTPLDYLPKSLQNLPLVALDEAGPYRYIAPFSADILPGLKNKTSQVNRSGLSFLDLPERKHGTSPVRDIRKILVSFGGEDPAGLSGKFLKGLEQNPPLKQSWTFVEGPFFKAPLQEQISQKIQYMDILKSPPALKDLLSSYDLVICSYGLTAFEAVASGTSVLLVNPGSYHDRLSRQNGFPLISGGWKTGSDHLLKNVIKEWEDSNFPDRNRALQARYSGGGESFPEWIETLTPGRNICPLCGSRENRSIARYEHKSYFSCENNHCGIVYMLNFYQKVDLYSSSYFFEDYQKQYGRTYLEDFPNIKEMGYGRIKRIKAINRRVRTLLDVGCAFGPFLSAAAEKRFQCSGIDVSREGVDYINNQLKGIRAFCTSLEDFNPRKEGEVSSYDVISLWYVMEHFQMPGLVLDKIRSILGDGGILAFSTPNGKGVSGLFSRRNFFRSSPDDHFTVWDRKSAVRILKSRGFGNIRFHVTGYHPERLPLALPFRRFWNKTVLLWFCKLFRLGDTFEIYCQKKGTQ